MRWEEEQNKWMDGHVFFFFLCLFAVPRPLVSNNTKIQKAKVAGDEQELISENTGSLMQTHTVMQVLAS